MNTLELADFLTAHAKKLTTFLSNNEVPFILAATELRWLSAIEQAAIAMFNSDSRSDTEQSAKALAIALGLFNPTGTEPSSRNQALAQLVKGVKAWPETCCSYIAPKGWEWVKPTGHEVSLCKIGEVGIFKQDWQRAQTGTSPANLAGG